MKKGPTIAEVYAALKKPLVIMKFTLVFIVFFTFNSLGGTNAQNITLNASNKEIGQVLSSIEKQGDYRFIFNSRLKDLKQKVSVNFSNTAITEALTKMFTGTNLTYVLLENNLVAIRAAGAADAADADIRVEGKVTSATGEPISGASVVVKGSSSGTYTDAQGNFAITVADNATLVISAVGYSTTEIAVAGKQQIDVQLTQSTAQMDEVVVIGYGTANKRDLTGSIVKVSGREVADKPNVNPVASLQSKVAGLSVVNSGTPGQAPDIRIRGTNSLGGNLKPLYVVDGIFNDNIDFLNPADIESLEILKDPSSLAIFGVRGANGVIAITTKKGKAGVTNVNFNTAFGFKKLVDKIEWANASEFQMLFDEEKTNDGTILTSPFNYNLWNANTDWVDAVTRTGTFNTNNISLSTGNDKHKFYMGLGYAVDQGIIKREELKKYLINISDEIKVKPWLKMGVNLNINKQDNPYGAGWVLDAARKVLPQVPAGTKTVRTKNPYGLDSANYNLYYALPGIQNSGVINPLLTLENEWDKTISRELRTVGSAFAEFTFLRNFTFRSAFYADMSNVNSRVYTPLYNAWDAEGNQPFLASFRTRVGESSLDYKKFQTDNILTWKGTLADDHNLTVMTGFTTFDDRYAGRFGGVAQSSTGNAIPNDPRFWYLTNGFEDRTTATNSSGQRRWTTASYLVRGIYNFQNKYFLNGSFRYDGTSAFPNNTWEPFWAVGAAWEVTKEKFMNSVSAIDFLKLRASTGLLGIQNRGNYDYPAYPLLTTGGGVPFGNITYTVAEPQYTPDRDLQWEKNRAFEAGFELETFQRKLHLDVAYYNKKTTDLLSYVDNIGFRDALINQGSIRNSGVEVSATWKQPISNDFELTVNGNFTTYKSEVLELANNGTPIITNASIIKVGAPVGAFYGYIVDGLYQSYADKLASPVNTDFAYGPGDFKYRDVNGDGIISSLDRTIIGDPTPDFAYGGSVNLRYKGLDIGVDFGGVYGNEIYRMWGSSESPFQRVNYPKFKTARWNGPGTSNWDPILGQGHRINYEYSTYGIEDGSYFTWKNNRGYSPEFGGSGLEFGVDRAGNAIPMVTTFGLNANF
ncbi:MAG: SusC/RagA family TonB-linked outer membrane protein [Sphingobacteriales bacterium]|nr:MAG: SusC/RagA family TonB-linked outer membrane protein [Sphingobacteriales bacterium]